MEIVVFDCETGGLQSDAHPIIQLAAVACEMPAWKEVEAFEAKVAFDPGLCEPQALELNSYSPDAWTGAAPWRVVADNFGAFLRRHSTVGKISRAGNVYFVAQGCAHNAPFDFEFLAAGFKREGLFLPMSYGPLCTLQLARWVSFGAKKQPADHKLATLCEFYGIEHENAHDALGDVRATALLASTLSAAISGRNNA